MRAQPGYHLDGIGVPDKKGKVILEDGIRQFPTLDDAISFFESQPPDRLYKTNNECECPGACFLQQYWNYPDAVVTIRNDINLDNAEAMFEDIPCEIYMVKLALKVDAEPGSTITNARVLEICKSLQ